MSSWGAGPSPERIAEIVAAAVSCGALAADERSVVFHDLGLMVERFAELGALFPDTALHAVAIKANPLVEVLRRLVERGAGLEAASIEEVHVALASGCPAERIVFDSPAKTFAELDRCLDLGVVINADSLTELDRIAELRRGRETHSRVGLRVNPEVGSGRISTTSVAGRGSKFGVPADRDRAAIVDAFKRNPWLDGIHVHAGSQGCDLDLLVGAATRA